LPTYVRPEFTAAPIGIHGRLSVANRVQERERGLGCVAPILGAANSRDEERHHLVADQLVDDRVMMDKRFGRGMVEAVERGGKSLRAKLLAQRRGTSHFGEEHRDIHLPPPTRSWCHARSLSVTASGWVDMSFPPRVRSRQLA
jgi:hypothetical protein